jgi:hypothetical protein
MGECRHLIAHWTAAAEREQLLDGIDYARSIGDLTGLLGAPGTRGVRVSVDDPHGCARNVDLCFADTTL